MATLTAKQRNRLKRSTFAIPEKRAYPIPDQGHAQAALSMVAQHGTPTEQKRVRAAVDRKFPGLRKRRLSPSAAARLRKSA